MAASPEHAKHAARLAALLRGMGVRTMLDAGRSVEEAVSQARAGGIGQVIAVSGPIEATGTMTLHDSRSGATSDLVAGDLARFKA